MEYGHGRGHLRQNCSGVEKLYRRIGYVWCRWATKACQVQVPGERLTGTEVSHGSFAFDPWMSDKSSDTTHIRIRALQHRPCVSVQHCRRIEDMIQQPAHCQSSLTNIRSVNRNYSLSSPTSLHRPCTHCPSHTHSHSPTTKQWPQQSPPVAPPFPG
jgi:hypothetical protein